MLDYDPAAILVVGAGGYFGRLLVDELLRFSPLHVVAAGRRLQRMDTLCGALPTQFVARVRPVAVDLHKPTTVRAALDGVAVAVCAAGPYHCLPLTLLEACLDHGVHYIDLADDRGFVRRVRAAVGAREPSGELPAVCSGWSAVPGLSGVLARITVAGMDTVDTIDIHIAPGNRAPRAAATVAALLHSVGRQFEVWRDGRWRQVSGWSQPRTFEFPPPVGRRTGYLVDVPDHELFPAVFGARTIEFRVGAEIGVLNRLVSVLARLSRWGIVRTWERAAGPLGRASTLTGSMGTDCGAVGVWATGQRAGQPVARSACVVAAHAGQHIPVMPAVIMSTVLASDPPRWQGLVPIDAWLAAAQLEAECARRGYELIIRPGSH